MASKGLLKSSDEVTVKLHRMDCSCRRGQETIGQSPTTRTHLQDAIPVLKFRGLNDSIQHSLIAQPVLAKTLAGRVP